MPWVISDKSPTSTFTSWTLARRCDWLYDCWDDCLYDCWDDCLSATVPLHHGDDLKCPVLPHFQHSALRAGHASRADERWTYPQRGHLFLGSFDVSPRDGWRDLNGLPLEKCFWLVMWLTSDATCVLTSSRMRAISTVFDSVNVESCSSCNFKDSSLSDMPAIILSRIFSSSSSPKSQDSASSCKHLKNASTDCPGICERW